MHAVALLEKPTEHEPGAFKSGVRPTPSFFGPSVGGVVVQCKESCACGGGCPRCQHDLPLQAKPDVSQPGDIHEQEADRVADQITAMPTPSVSRACAGCANGGPCSKCKDEEAKPSVLRTADADSHQGSRAVGDDFVHGLGSGELLDHGTRAFMEPRFGYDFSRVRVHTNPQANELARSINASAFTVGRNVVFAKGQYSPDTTSGQRLLAHELTHVVQQSSGSPLVSEAQRETGIQRYSHQDCTDPDLRAHIWPADAIARQMVTKAIRVLRASPINPLVIPLLSKNFMTSTPVIADILAVFDKVNADFTTNTYQYECEDDCENDNAYVYWFWTDIHLCMNKLRGKANDCIASTIVHEFTHYSANLDDESGRCYGCATFPGCPAGLTPSNALDNADSYAAFAYELFPMSV